MLSDIRDKLFCHAARTNPHRIRRYRACGLEAPGAATTAANDIAAAAAAPSGNLSVGPRSGLASTTGAAAAGQGAAGTNGQAETTMMMSSGARGAGPPALRAAGSLFLVCSALAAGS
uniref:Uncharacterized protein n=2 Tax=Alexandrium monilatum TaxID=311494 RepID=A0A7S4T1A9_9DINO